MWGAYKNSAGQNQSTFHFLLLKLIRSDTIYGNNTTFPVTFLGPHFIFESLQQEAWQQRIGQGLLSVVRKSTVTWSQDGREAALSQNQVILQTQCAAGGRCGSVVRGSKVLFLALMSGSSLTPAILASGDPRSCSCLHGYICPPPPPSLSVSVFLTLSFSHAHTNT